MPVSSQSFFQNLNHNYPEINFLGKADKQAEETLFSQIRKIQPELHYKDISETDMIYVANVLNQNQKKSNLLLTALIRDQNLDKENKKRKYIEHLLHNLYFVELQALIFQGYGKKEAAVAAEQAAKIRQQIADLLANNDNPEKKTVKAALSFCEQAWEFFKTAMVDLVAEFSSISKLIQLAGSMHIWRIALVFARITFQEMLLISSHLDFLVDFLAKHPNSYAGYEVNVKTLLDLIENSRVVFNSLSVALPALRLVLHTLLLIKHSCSSTAEEDELSAETRIWRELKKRYYVLGNDIVWTAINFITNFNKISRISAGNAMAITAAFMLFDILWMLPGWYIAFDEYKEQKALLEAELAQLEKDSPEYSSVFQNLKQLDINWQAKSDTYLYSVIATGLFGLGFIIATLVPALAIPAYLLCNFAMALNMVGGDFTLLREKKMAVDLTPVSLEPALQVEREILEAEYSMARNNFLVTLAVYTVLPALTMGVFAICWPAAIPLVAAMIAFQLLYPKWKAHQQETIEDMRKVQNDKLIGQLFDSPEDSSAEDKPAIILMQDKRLSLGA